MGVEAALGNGEAKAIRNVHGIAEVSWLDSDEISSMVDRV